MQNSKWFSGTVLIGYSFDTDGNSLVAVGKQENGKDVEIINAFSGDKAKDIAPGFIAGVISLYEAVQQGVVDNKQLADLLDDMTGVEISSKLLGGKADAEQ